MTTGAEEADKSPKPARSVADDPIDGSEAFPDTLGRSGFARAVAAAISPMREQDSSSVVALVGPWGSGKTSIMKLALKELRKQAAEPSWNVVHFNPWLFQDLPSLQVGFLGALQGAVGRKSKLRGLKIRSALSSVGKRIAPFGALGAFWGWNLSGPIRGLSHLITRQENPTKDQSELEKLLGKDKTPVLVVLDDLDRLAPSELLLVFKLIRLVGRLPYVHYLVMYDEDTLLDVLSRTGLVGKRDVRRSSDYLEKMIQLRLDVPRQIVDALGLPTPTIAAALQAMTQAGLLIPDPPASEARRGQRVRYVVDDEVVSRMYLQLGQAIGEL